MKVYNIIEVANVHGGDINYLLNLIDSFGEFNGNFGIKFQPFKYDLIALPDFSWYSVYQELFFTEDQWKDIIRHALPTKDIWIDVFDLYSVRIVEQNLENIYGLKLQSSVIYNEEILEALTKLELSKKVLVINVAAYTIEDIEDILNSFKSRFDVTNIVLQIGFQEYPTKLEDSGLSKITLLKDRFKIMVAFADHVDANTEESIWLPVIAAMNGADIIEKHVKLPKIPAKYDYYSSSDVNQYEKYILKLKDFLDLQKQPFICEREKAYLKKSMMLPVIKDKRLAGTPVSLKEDFIFRRTDQDGLTYVKLKDKIKGFQVLAENKDAGTTVRSKDLRKAIIATIIACRLKSSRLPKKALRKIGKQSSIELCLKNALSFNNVDHTILATSTVSEDKELVDYTYSDSVIFHRGDPDDVIKRYLGVIDKYKIDVVVRVTADMPYISDEILQILLKSHFERGADYTIGKKAAVGTNLEIINTAALKKVKAYFPNADYSEYMTWYFQNNPEHFRLNFVELPKNLVRDYRLTLDYPEDLTMLNKIAEHFENKKILFSLKALYEFLDNNPKVARINADCDLAYKTNKKLIATLNEKTKIS